jgi:hypothetical protein
LIRSDSAGQARGRRLCCGFSGLTAFGVPARNVISPFRIELGRSGGQWFPLIFKKSVEADSCRRRNTGIFDWPGVCEDKEEPGHPKARTGIAPEFFMTGRHACLPGEEPFARLQTRGQARGFLIGEFTIREQVAHALKLPASRGIGGG